MNDFNDNKLSAIIGIGGVLLSVFIFILSAKTDSGVLAVIGLIVFVLAIVAGKITEKVTKASDKAKHLRGLSGGSVNITSKYQLLLMDERTKQDPDVQRLLQYLSVQKAFFDPNYITSAAAQNDPYVRELLEVFDRLTGGSEVNGDFAQYPSTGSFSDPNSSYLSEMKRHEIEQRERGKNRPRRIVGRIIKYVGLGIFFIPFVIMFLSPTGVKNGESAAYFFMAAPFGMIMAAIGSKIR